MTVVPKVGVIKEHRVVFYNGVNYPKDSTTNVSTSVTESKVSVDTGSFVPGKYRVNPYYVMGETIASGGSYSLSFLSADGSRAYSYDVTGAVNLKASALCKSYTPSFLDVGNLRERALVQATNKLGEADMALGESIGELKETINLLHHPLRELRDYLTVNGLDNLTKFKRLLKYAKDGSWPGVIAGSKQAGKLAAGAWMEIRYGLRPLCYMVQDAIEMVNKADKKGFSPTLVRSKRSKLDKSEDYTSPPVSSPISAYTGTRITVSGTNSVKVYAAVQYLMSRPNSLTEDLGLTIPYLPETAWELTRLSFVVDWFLAIGPWLGSFRVKPTITVLGNTVGTKLETSSTGLCELWSKDDPTRKTLLTQSMGVFHRSSYERVVNYNMPILPQWTGGDVIDLFRAIDGAAIIIQSIKF